MYFWQISEKLSNPMTALERIGHRLLCSSCLNFSSPVICLFLPSRPDHMCEHMKDHLYLEFTLSRCDITLSKIYQFSWCTCVYLCVESLRVQKVSP